MISSVQNTFHSCLPSITIQFCFVHFFVMSTILAYQFECQAGIIKYILTRYLEAHKLSHVADYFMYPKVYELDLLPYHFK